MRKILLFVRAIAIGFILLFGSGFVMGQIAAWDYTGPGAYVTFPATIFNTNLVSSSGANNITRGITAAASAGTNSFRTVGFKNEGISTSNTDYFQITLTALSGYELSLSTIDAKFAGTSTFYASPGVTSQFAYSLDGLSFTLIGSSVQSTSLTLNQIDLSGISALQNVSYGTTITLRYYASGQTTTGGWGFYSSAFGMNGFAIGGTLNPIASTPAITVTPSTLTDFSYTEGSGPSAEQSFEVSGANLGYNISITPPADYEISTGTGGSFSATNPIVLTVIGGIVYPGKIYTRLKAGISTGSYNREVITATSTDAADKTVTCSGNVLVPTPKIMITEVMQNPNDVTDANGEWFEIYNYGVTSVDINGYIIKDLGTDNHTIDNGGTLNISAGSFLVLGISSTTLTNGCVPVDYKYASISLGNGADELILYMPDGTTEVDKIEWDGGPNWPDPTGAAMTYTGTYSENNNDGSKWITAIRRENNYINPLSTETDLGSPSKNGFGQNLVTLSNWTGIGNWSEGNDVGNTNWSNGIPGSSTNVTVSGSCTISSAVSCNNILIEDGASLIGAENLTVAGTSTMQRTISAYNTNADGWHLLSSPVNSMAIAGSDFEPGSSDDFYAWDESTYTWMNYKNGDPSQMVPGTGYLVAYQTIATKDFVGTFNSTDITYSNLSKTADKGDGWHLLGNPFQSAIEWNTTNWSVNNVTAGAKFMNSGGSYTDISDGGFIPANQGFFVQALDASNSITIPMSQRVHSSTSFYKSEPANVLTLKASDGDFYVETWIQIKDGATLGFDAKYDMNFLGGVQNAPYLYSAISETEKLSTNRIAPVEQLTEVPLAFKSFLNKEFTISTTNANSFDSDIDVYLKDKVTNSSINLKETPKYTFTVTAGELTDRFVVQLFKVGTGTRDTEFQGVHIFSNGEQIFLQSKLDRKALVTVYNMLGQEVYNKSLMISGLQSLDLRQEAGWYIVQLIGEQGVVKEKVFLK